MIIYFRKHFYHKIYQLHECTVQKTYMNVTQFTGNENSIGNDKNRKQKIYEIITAYKEVTRNIKYFDNSMYIARRIL